ncbi:unnamed protein product [Mycena citricolor]|uniref:Beta-lactamase-related domain-containing protein n=1 Tax=Mycena citricolor TaxID=2018698 RepID=A0AAD2HSM3_9AGAR|nr:unnamed protein product [Mycena citricolor]
MDGKLELNPRERPRKWSLKRLTASIFAIVCATLYALDRRVVISIVSKHTTSVTPTQYKKCQPPLPTLLAGRPPTPDSPRFKTAIASLDSFLTTRAAASDIDSLSVSVVTPAGPLFERGYGLLKANDTTSTETVTRDSAYRIASISKMFTVFETLILRDMGMLNWDDPVAKFLPNFTHPKEGWSSYLQGEYSADKSPITLRQLATHMSGLGRDYPPENFGDVWPLPLDEVERDDGKAGRTGTAEALLEAAMHYPLVAPQYTFPVYSNTGFDLLGLCNVAAFEMVTGRVNVTHHELLDEHIFQPLGLTSSFYRIANASIATRVAIPSSDFEWAVSVSPGPSCMVDDVWHRI